MKIISKFGDIEVVAHPCVQENWLIIETKTEDGLAKEALIFDIEKEKLYKFDFSLINFLATEKLFHPKITNIS